jgi:hypothetical protein
MARREDWQIEIDDAIRNEIWQRTGRNRPVKVCPAEWMIDFRLGGYITLGKYLVGKTPAEIERDLGLPSDFLLHGARIYKFTRLPQISEYEYQLTADHPDGFADEGPFPRKPYYPRAAPRSTSGGFFPAKPSP